MIKIIAKNHVKPESIQSFIEETKELIKKSREEEGNVFYTLNVSKADPNTLTFIECWKDQAAIDFHNKTEHFTTIVPKLSAFCEREGEVELYEEICGEN